MPPTPLDVRVDVLRPAVRVSAGQDPLATPGVSPPSRTLSGW
jgi:hypothetical protein